MDESEYAKAFEQIVADPSLTELEKLVRAFRLVTQEYVALYKHEAELARAIGDKETAVREELKAGMIQSAQGMFGHCYLRITGSREKLWHE